MGIDALHGRAAMSCGIGKECKRRLLGLALGHAFDNPSSRCNSSHGFGAACHVARRTVHCASVLSRPHPRRLVMTQLPHVLKRIRLNLAR